MADTPEEIATEASLHALRTQVAAIQTVLADIWDVNHHCLRVRVIVFPANEAAVAASPSITPAEA